MMLSPRPRPITRPARLPEIRAWALALTAAFQVSAAPVILNEYNAVGDSRFLATDTVEGATNSDAFFGRVQGNGGDWFELAVVADHVDLRGWRFEWSYSKDASNHGSGAIVVGDVQALADLRAGTILTLVERPSTSGGLDTDLSFAPRNGDWWINLCSRDTNVATTEGLVVEKGVTNALGKGAFRVNNDDWTLTLRDRSGALVFGPAGEGAPDWAGPGISGNEVGSLQAEPTTLIRPSSAYSDGTTSTFGLPNSWGNGLRQDFSLLRSPLVGDPGTQRKVASNAS